MFNSSILLRRILNVNQNVDYYIISIVHITFFQSSVVSTVIHVRLHTAPTTSSNTVRMER